MAELVKGRSPCSSLQVQAGVGSPCSFFFCIVTLSSLLGFWLIRPGLMRNSERPDFPTFAALGKGRPALRNFIMRFRVGCLSSRRLLCRGLLEKFLLRPFIVRALLLVVWMAGVCGSSRLCLFPGLVVLLAFCLVLRILGFGLRGCLMLTLL